jgi:hypothetical protein
MKKSTFLFVQIAIREVIKLFLFLIPLFLLFYLKIIGFPIFIFSVLLLIIVFTIFYLKKYSIPTYIDKYFQLDNAYITYFQYKDSPTPFHSYLFTHLQKNLKNVKLKIFPSFENIMASLVTVLIILVIFGQRESENLPQLPPKTISQNIKSNENFLKDMITKKENSATNKSSVNLPPKKDVPIKVELPHPPPTMEQNFNFLIKNLITKREKEVIMAILNENRRSR